jgi:molecular chaperone DnaK
LEKAIVGVPAYFKEPARRATKQAGLIAGFEEVHLVDEPTLAATFYGLAKGKTAKLAVFDFGGGTFDICILQVKEGGQIDPIAVNGDPECGGSNIDEALFQVVPHDVGRK